MQVSLSTLTGALNKVRKMAEGTKNVPGIMLDISENKMKVCYSDGKKSVIEIIEIQQSDPVVAGRIIVPYAKTMDIIDACQPSGSLMINEITMNFSEGSTLTIIASKKIVIGDEEGTEEKVQSKLEQKINYNKPEDSVQYQILSRMEYDAIFQNEEFDTWETKTLIETLSRTSKEKSKTIYISSQLKAAFVSNTAHVTNIPITSCEKYGMAVSTSLATPLIDILGKLASPRVAVSVKDNRYVSISSEDNTVGIWFEQAAANKMELSLLKRFQEKTYDKYELVFYREALQDTIDRALKSDSNEKTTLTFIKDENDSLSARVQFAGSGGSTANDFTVVLTNYEDKEKNKEEDKQTKIKDILGAQIPVNLKVLSDMINNCKEFYVAFDISNEDGSTLIRVGDLEMSAEKAFTATHYTMLAKQ